MRSDLTLKQSQLQKGSTGAGLGASWPALSLVLAENAANQQDRRKQDPLDRHRRPDDCVCAAMSPEHVSQIKDRRPVGCASVEHSKQCLEELIQVNCGNYATIELKKGFSGIPPRVNDPSGKSRTTSGLHN